LDKQRLFVDMDGTLAVFKPVDKIETLYEKGYFLNLQPIDNVVEAVKNIVKNNPEIEVYILSAALKDSKYAIEEKNYWLDKYLPEIDMQHRIFPPCGADKKSYIPGKIRETDFLLDDYTNNLILWEPPARGIKLLNGINHTNGTWKHDRIRFDKSPEELSRNIVDIMNGIAIITDEKPNLLYSDKILKNVFVNEESSSITINGYIGTWYVIDTKEINGEKLFLLESEKFGDQAACLIVDETGLVKLDEVYNGFDDYEDYLQIQQDISRACGEQLNNDEDMEYGG
jgi:5'(3')-deoxyribonucleotidase